MLYIYVYVYMCIYICVYTYIYICMVLVSGEESNGYPGHRPMAAVVRFLPTSRCRDILYALTCENMAS